VEERTIEFINQIFEQDIDLGDLLIVEYLVESTLPESIEAIIFNFENQAFTIKVVIDDDSIEVVSGRASSEPSHNIISVSKNKPWSLAIGKRIIWSWALINHQGYHDAIQFEFAKDLSDSSVIIQLIAAALSIRIYELNETHIDS
jgi:hypothetical protein